VQVDRVEHDARVWREPAHRIDMPCGHVMPRQHDHVEFASALRQQLRNRAYVRMKQHLDAAPLQCAHIRLVVFEVVGDERRLAAERRREFEQRLHAQRA
jgi:hypothetical protein